MPIPWLGNLLAGRPSSDLSPPAKDLRDITAVAVYSNLGNLIAPVPTFVPPPGTTSAVLATIINSYDNLGLPSDIEQIAATLIPSGLVTIVASQADINSQLVTPVLGPIPSAAIVFGTTATSGTSPSAAVPGTVTLPTTGTTLTFS